MNIGVIPLRAGSQRIPGKNKKILAGKELFRWVLDEAIKSKLDNIYIFSDDPKIAGIVAEKYFNIDKIKYIKRGKENATDKAGTEDAMVEFCDKIDWNFDNIMLLQATSPLTKAQDIDDALWMLENSEYDSIISCVKQKRFIWDKTGYAKNYNIFNRPLTQSYEGYYVENGAIYLTSQFKATHNRISGDIGIMEMPEETYIEIDTPKDWEVMEALIKPIELPFAPKHYGLFDIRLIMTDSDGVLTDGGMYYGDTEYKKFNTRDGMGFELLKDAGYRVGIISGENTQSIRDRGKKLKLDHLVLGSKDKAYDLYPYLAYGGKCRQTYKNLAYIGDDVNDIELLENAGFSACPADAHEEVKKRCDYICDAKGGEGVFREVADLILKEAENG